VVRRGDSLNAKEVGKRIQRARLEANGMTQRELSLEVKATERTVAEWERGGYIPYRYLHALESVLDRPAAWFLYGEEPDGDNHSSSRLEEKLDHIIELLEAIQPPKKGRKS